MGEWVTANQARVHLKDWSKKGIKRVIFAPAPDCCPQCEALRGEYEIEKAPLVVRDTHEHCRCWYTLPSNCFDQIYKKDVESGREMAKGKMICTTCGYVGDQIKDIRGGCLTELILWLLFLIPGIIYSIWRLTTKKKVCPSCKNPTMIPIDSPIGRKLFAEQTTK